MTLGIIAISLVMLLFWSIVGLIISILFIIPFVLGLLYALGFICLCAIFLYFIGKSG